MSFDKAKISGMLRTMAARMLPGWTYELIFAKSVEEIGCLGMIEPLPQRKQFKMWIAPHPPNESYEETLAHELTHGILSPLTHLLPPSGSVVMIEEMIVEPLGIELAKLFSGAPQYARAMLRAIQNPRTTSPALRTRITALASGRPGKERKRMLSAEQLTKALEALESGDPEATKAILKELIAAMATGGDAGPASAPAREDKNDDALAGGPVMREEDMPPQMRAMFRNARRSSAMMLSDTVRLRIHTAKTVDGIVLDAETETDLTKCTTVEQFDREFRLVKRMASKGNEQQRARSGVVPSKATTDIAPDALNLDELLKEGIPDQLARELVETSKRNRAAADAELAGARQRIAHQKNGGK